jgi:hypothetical protein
VSSCRQTETAAVACRLARPAARSRNRTD